MSTVSAPHPDAAGSCVRQRSIIGLGLGAAEALAGEAASSWEALAGLQKQLTLALVEAELLGGGSSSVLDFFMDAIGSARQHKVRHRQQALGCCITRAVVPMCRNACSMLHQLLGAVVASSAAG